MIRSFRHKGLRKLFEEDDRKLIRPDLVARVATVLALLDAAVAAEDLATPSLRLHRLKGDLKGHWAVTVRANWRITFTFDDGGASDVDLVDYHRRLVPMKAPPHPGLAVKDELDELGLSVAEAAEGLGVARQTLHRLISGESGISPEMAYRLERGMGSNADFWLRLQANYDLAEVRRHADAITVRRLVPRQTPAATDAPSA